ncbi:MAG: A24 family peptidase [Candidatus Pacearchaeota archaeon]
MLGAIVVLIGRALVWLIFATIQDLKQREIANWLNFSLLIFGLGFRFFYSLFLDNFGFFVQGLIWLGIFFIFAILLYYLRFFAGGDFKLMFSLGVIIPISSSFLINLKVSFVFVILFFFVGFLYTIFSSFFLVFKNFEGFSRKFKAEFNNYYTIFLISSILIFVLLLAVFFKYINFLFSIPLFIILLIPYLYIYLKTVESLFLVKSVRVGDIKEGDWLYKEVRLPSKVIKSNWEGLSKEDIKELKKYRKRVFIRYGIPFSPVFLVSFLILILFLHFDFVSVLWNSFW